MARGVLRSGSLFSVAFPWPVVLGFLLSIGLLAVMILGLPAPAPDVDPPPSWTGAVHSGVPPVAAGGVGSRSWW